MSIKRSEIILVSLENEEKAFKMLLREKFTNEEKSLSDKIFIDHHIAEFYHKKKNDLVYHYIDEVEKIFDCEIVREQYKIDYVKFLNLYTNVYEKKISKEKFNNILDTVKKISKELNNYYYYNKMKDKIYKEKNIINQIAEGCSLEAIYT